MLQAAVDRLGAMVPPERILIATRSDLADVVQSQLTHLSSRSILAEPCARNTAPCIGWAASRIVRDDPDATMLVLPADQVISPPQRFRDAALQAAELVEEDPRRLVTFGIKPTHPSVGFGYIERGESLPTAGQASSGTHGDTASPVHRVVRFHEKPTRAVAQEYLSSGKYLWNAGIFAWKAQTLLDALARFRPAVHAGLMRIAAAAGSPRRVEVEEREFAAMEKISIDFAVMERAEEVVVVEAPFQWDDVGGWLALERYRPKDDQGNVTDAARHLAIDSSGNVIRGHDPKHVVVVAGVKDLVVVVTPDATLVANKHDEKAIAQITEELRRRGWTEYL